MNSKTTALTLALAGALTTALAADGSVVGLSAGLIGPPRAPRDYAGSLSGKPVFIRCSDRDPHIPLTRIQESTAVLRRLGSNLTVRIYPGMNHTINDDEVKHVRSILAGLVQSSPNRIAVE